MDPQNFSARELPKLENFLTKEEVQFIEDIAESYLDDQRLMQSVKTYSRNIIDNVIEQETTLGIEYQTDDIDPEMRKQALENAFTKYGLPLIYSHDVIVDQEQQVVGTFIQIIKLSFFTSRDPICKSSFEKFQNYIETSFPELLNSRLSYSVMIISGNTNVVKHSDKSQGVQILVPISEVQSVLTGFYDKRNLDKPEAQYKLKQFVPLLYNITKIHDAQIRQDKPLVLYRVAFDHEDAESLVDSQVGVRG